MLEIWAEGLKNRERAENVSHCQNYCQQSERSYLEKRREHYIDKRPDGTRPCLKIVGTLTRC